MSRRPGGLERSEKGAPDRMIRRLRHIKWQNTAIFGTIAHTPTTTRVSSSVVERCPDKTEVEGPIPSTPTNTQKSYSHLNSFFV